MKIQIKSMKESKSLKEWFSEKDFKAMSPEEQREYLDQHPNSKFQPDNDGSEDNKTSNQDKVDTSQGNDTQQSKDKEGSDSDLLKQLTDIENQLKKARYDLSWQKKYDQIPANIENGGKLSPGTEKLIYDLEKKKSALNKKIKDSGKSREELSAKADPSTWFGLQDKQATYKDQLPSMSKILKFEIPKSSFDTLDDKVKEKYKKAIFNYKLIPTIEKLAKDNELAENFQNIRKQWTKARNSSNYEEATRLIKEFNKLAKSKGYDINDESVRSLFFDSPNLDKAIKKTTKYFKDELGNTKWNTLAELGALPYRVEHNNMFDSYVTYTWDKNKK